MGVNEERAAKYFMYGACALEILVSIFLIFAGIGILVISATFGWWTAIDTVCGVTYVVLAFLIILFMLYMIQGKGWAKGGLITLNGLIILINLVILIIYWPFLLDITIDVLFIILNILPIGLLLASSYFEDKPLFGSLFEKSY